MEKFRLQIAFDVKDENNRSVLSENYPNTISRSILVKPAVVQIKALSAAITKALSLCEEDPLFQNLFCVKIDLGDNKDGNPLAEIRYLEIPVEGQHYHSLIHSKRDNRLIPFVNKELWINRDAFSKTRLWLRKIRYYKSCLCELIRS